MEYLYAFIYGGLICLAGQIILDNTKLTAGHITSVFVSLGAVLGFLGIYDNILNLAHAGANLPITSFGNLLYKACYTGYMTDGILGMFTAMFTTTSGVITATLIFSFVFCLILKPKD